MGQKAALYVRVSTKYQIDKDSLPLQKRDLVNYAKIILGIDDYVIFEDEGYSGKNTKRPAFQDMMTRIKNNEFTHLLVWKIDRISRNLLDFAEMYENIKAKDVVFISKQEQFDTSNAMGEAMLKIILVFAELERNITSERVQAVMLQRASDGRWNGGRVALGYDYDAETNTFTINEEQAEIVRFIFDMYAECQSTNKLASMLNDNPLTSKYGNWTPNKINRILRNEFYTGTLVYNKRREASTSVMKPESEWIYVTDHHPAIIKPEQQIQAMSLLKEQNRGTYRRVHTHIFSGKVVCGKCGRNMRAMPSKPRKDGFVQSCYLCSKRTETGQCDNRYIKDSDIGPFVLNLISNIIKAANSTGKYSTIEAFEKKLLRGLEFDDIDYIDIEGLKNLFDSLKTVGGDESVSILTSGKMHAVSEFDTLVAERSKLINSLDRLEDLYISAEQGITKKNYLIKRSNIEKKLDEIDGKLKNDEIERFEDEVFLNQASAFILGNDLLEKRHIEFDKLVVTLDKEVIKKLVNMTIKKIVVVDGKITNIKFTNETELTFRYKQ